MLIIGGDQENKPRGERRTVTDGDDASTPLDVAILAGRLGLDDDGRPLGPLLDRLERRGIAPRIVLADPRGEGGADPRVTVVPALARPWLRPWAVRRLAGRASLRPAVLHALGPEVADVALALAETWRVPYLQTVDDFRAAEEGLRISRRWLRALVASGAELRDFMVGDLGVPSNLVAVVPPAMTVDPLPRPPGGAATAVVGVADPPLAETGFATFLEAAGSVLARGRDVEFLIAARGGDSMTVHRRAQSSSIQERVTVVDLVRVGVGFWSVLDVYCQPTLAADAGRSLALAMARGIPCVVSDVPGLRGLIQPGRSGLVVPPGDAAALADDVIRLLDDREAAAAMAETARDDVRSRFDPDVEADRLAALYREAANSEAGTSSTS